MHNCIISWRRFFLQTTPGECWVDKQHATIFHNKHIRIISCGLVIHNILAAIYSGYDGINIITNGSFINSPCTCYDKEYCEERQNLH